MNYEDIKLQLDVSQGSGPYEQVRNFGLVVANQNALSKKLDLIWEKLEVIDSSVGGGLIQ